MHAEDAVIGSRFLLLRPLPNVISLALYAEGRTKIIFGSLCLCSAALSFFFGSMSMQRAAISFSLALYGCAEGRTTVRCTCRPQSRARPLGLSTPPTSPPPPLLTQSDRQRPCWRRAADDSDEPAAAMLQARPFGSALRSASAQVRESRPACSAVLAVADGSCRNCQCTDLRR